MVPGQIRYLLFRVEQEQRTDGARVLDIEPRPKASPSGLLGKQTTPLYLRSDECQLRGADTCFG